MASLPPTQPTLLVRIRNAHDHDAWTRFVDLYAPLVYGFLRKRGLQDADAADLTQDVLRKVAVAVKQFDYDTTRGSFRSWLLTIVQNSLATYWRGDPHKERAGGDSEAYLMLNEIAQPVNNGDSVEWDAEYQRQIFHFAANVVKQDFTPTTWQAFWQTAVEGRSGKELAEELQMSVAAVYLAKGRVMNRIKDQVKLLVGETDE